MHNVIVIGSGIAGLNFALNAAPYGKVLIVTKKKAIEAGTNYAQGGIAGVLSKYDSFEKHITDTLEAGAYHNDKKAVKFMVEKAPEAIHNLIEYGVNFASHRGEILLTQEGGHSERRIAFVGDYTGKEIEETLLKNVKKHPNIEISEHTFASELILDKKKKTCLGVEVIKNKKIKNLFANIIVLATGGCGQVYLHTTNPDISTGDGLAMAETAGLKFKDLEFIQFHPTAFNYWGEAKFLISEAVRGEGAYLRNVKGERFMLKIHPQAELAPRDIVAREIYEESKKGQVYLDITHKDPKEIKLRFPKIYQWLKEYEFDLTKNLIPITPAAHYCCGGIKVNLKGESGIKNLYAFGEVACTGVHGANRLASNSLVEALVFSNQILKATLLSVAKPPKATIHIVANIVANIVAERNATKSYLPLQKPLKDKLNSIQTEIKTIMWNKVGIIRKKEEMQTALKELQALKATLLSVAKPSPKATIHIVANIVANIVAERNATNATNEKLIETKNLLATAQLITKAALKREKSLGGHYLISSLHDYPSSKNHHTKYHNQNCH